MKTPIASSNISEVEYDPERQVLSVTFTNGRTYEYYGVTQEIFDTFLQAPSKGKYLNAVIKPGCPCQPA